MPRADLYLYEFRDFKFKLTTRFKNPKAGALSSDALVGRPRTYRNCARFKRKIQKLFDFRGVANRDGFFVYDGGVEELDAMIRAVIGSASKSAPVSDVESEDSAESAELVESVESAESADSIEFYRSKLITAQEMIIDLQAKLLKEASPTGPTGPTRPTSQAAVAYLSDLTEAYVRKHNRYPKTVRILTESPAATSELPGTDDELNVMLQEVIRTLKRQRSRHHRVEPSTSTEVEAM